MSLENDEVRVGITSLLSWVSGPISRVSFKPVGTELARGQSLGSFEGPKHFDVVRTPVTGRLVATNDSLLKSPELLNKDLYGKGWFAKVKPSDPAELKALSRLPDAQALILSRLRELGVRCFAEFPDLEMFELGTECSDVLVKVSQTMKESPSGTVLHLVSDDPVAPREMEAWSDGSGNPMLEWRKEENLFHILLKKK